MVTRLIACIIAVAAFSLAGMAAAATLAVTVENLSDGKAIPPEYALCVPSPEGKSGPGQNKRPTIHWTGAPQGTQSIAVFMMDPDVPTDFTDAGVEGKTIAATAPRQDFFHYGVVNIPATATALAGGDAKKSPRFGTQLVNDLGSYIPTPAQFGGPCPPWNDARLHHYHFMVLALDAPVPVTPKTTAKEAFSTLIHGPHVLAKGVVIGTYSLNPSRSR